MASRPLPFQAILFDFDGVLVDSEPVHYEAWCEILSPFGVVLDRQTYNDHWIGVSDRTMLSLLCEQLGSEIGEKIWAQYPRKRELFREKMLSREMITSEMRSLLEELTEYKLAVVTSSGRTEVEPVLSAAGVLERFDARVYGGDVKHHKPSPEPYLQAIERLGVATALVVEDSGAGVASGKAAGLEVLQVPSSQAVPAMVRLALNGG
jgi:beta-phosphoglucomutase